MDRSGGTTRQFESRIPPSSCKWTDAWSQIGNRPGNPYDCAKCVPRAESGAYLVTYRVSKRCVTIDRCEMTLPKNCTPSWELRGKQRREFCEAISRLRRPVNRICGRARKTARWVSEINYYLRTEISSFRINNSRRRVTVNPRAERNDAYAKIFFIMKRTIYVQLAESSARESSNNYTTRSRPSRIESEFPITSGTSATDVILRLITSLIECPLNGFK